MGDSPELVTVGQPLEQVHGVAKVDGSAVFTADVRRLALLSGQVLRSPSRTCPALFHVDTAARATLPACAVITAQDLRDALSASTGY